MAYIVWKALKNNLDQFLGSFVLRMSDFGGRWSVTLKNRGRSKKTEGRTRPKCKGGSLAVGTYLQRDSDPLGIWAYSVQVLRAPMLPQLCHLWPGAILTSDLADHR